VLRVTIQGVWLDMITTTPDYTIEEGLATIHACAAAFFPRHFRADGLIV
jgi:TetR/AcrR family transcriptional repressor of bet genes